MSRRLLLLAIALFCSMAFLAGNLWAATSSSKYAKKTKKQTELKAHSGLAKALKAAQQKTVKTAKLSSKKKAGTIKSAHKTGASKKTVAVKTKSPKKSSYLAKKSQNKAYRHKKRQPAKTQS